MFAMVCISCGGAGTPKFTDGGPPIAAASGERRVFGFDDDALGPPAGWIPVLGVWRVEADGDTRVLRQSVAASRDAFPRIVLASHVFGDTRISVRCRLEGGRIDQACGVMLRLRDSDNYNLVRVNALEQNVRFYRVVDGNRQQLATADLALTAGQWGDLVVEAVGPRFTVRWNGTAVLTGEDDEYPSGKVGLWTKADSITAFDDVIVEAL